MLDIRPLLQKKGLVVDANLIVLLVVGIYDEKRIEEYKRTKAYDIADYHLLVDFIKLFGKIKTTPNILTEASNLLEGLSYQYGPVLAALRPQLDVIDEVYLSSHTIIVDENKTYLKFGLSDTATFLMAKAGYVVLTDDLRLYAYLLNCGLEALTFDYLRSLSKV